MTVDFHSLPIYRHENRSGFSMSSLHVLVSVSSLMLAICNKLCAWRHNITCPSPLPVGAAEQTQRSSSDVSYPVPILVFLGLSVLELRPMYPTDRRQTKASLNAPAY